MKIREVHIEDYKIFKDFNIDFTFNNKPLSVIVIAGINGSGKSTLLEFIYKLVVLKTLPFNESDKIVGEVFDVDTNKLVPIIFKSPLQHSNVVSDNYPQYENAFNVLYYKTYETDIDSASQTIIKYIDKLIFEKDKKSSEVYSIITRKLNTLFNNFDLQIEFNYLDKERSIYFKNEKSEQIPISELSGGEKELITRAFSLYLSDVKNKVILIDEPETSLHPNWQNRILKIYEDFANENNNQIIIATHSPHIIASAKKESLRVLVKKGEKIEVISGFDGSYGYEVQRVLLEIMDLKSLRIPEIDKKIERLYDLLSNDDYESKEFTELQFELEELLGKNDKDLIMIRLEVAKRKKKNEKNS